MPPIAPKTLLASLISAMAFFSAGCMTTLEHPTRASIRNTVWDGDVIEVILKSGEKRELQVTTINDTEIRAGYENPVRLADIEKIRIANSTLNRHQKQIEREEFCRKSAR